MSLFLGDIRNAVKDHVRDRETVIAEEEYGRAINQALRFYSELFAYAKVNTETGDGSTYEWTLPADYYDDLSAINWVSYPADQAGERERPLLEVKTDYDILQTATGTWKLRFLLATPTSDETVKYEYSTLHTISDTASTLPNTKAEDKVIYAAASLCCEQMAAHYSQFKSSVFEGDLVDFSDKARMYKEKAEDYRARSGLAKVMAQTELEPACAIRDFDSPPPWGKNRDFVIHSRGRR